MGSASVQMSEKGRDLLDASAEVMASLRLLKKRAELRLIGEDDANQRSTTERW